jgi:hypothetical protein
MKIPRVHQPSLFAQRLRPREQATLDIVKANPGIACGDVAKRMGVKQTTATNYLNALMLARLAHSRGLGRGSAWWPGEAPKAAIQIARNPMGPNSVWGVAG